jgi:hypothetical protein
MHILRLYVCEFSKVGGGTDAGICENEAQGGDLEWFIWLSNVKRGIA